MELFDLPPAPRQRLDQETHDAVFGGLPSALAADLHSAEVGDLVLQLLDRGWRRGQIAARAGALPAGRDPVADVAALLHGFLEQVPPDARWREEKAARQAERDQLRHQQGSQAAFEQPATDESRQRWIDQIRSELGGPRRTPRGPVQRVRPACALCGEGSAYFVTHEVRLCDPCVCLLGTGTAKLSEAG